MIKNKSLDCIFRELVKNERYKDFIHSLRNFILTSVGLYINTKVLYKYMKDCLLQCCSSFLNLDITYDKCAPISGP